MKKRHHKKKGRIHHAKTMGMMTMGMKMPSIYENIGKQKKTSSVGILHELEKSKRTHKLGRVY
jgi:hypothetical protein